MEMLVVLLLLVVVIAHYANRVEETYPVGDDDSLGFNDPLGVD
jgi:hypothetical protein